MEFPLDFSTLEPTGIFAYNDFEQRSGKGECFHQRNGFALASGQYKQIINWMAIRRIQLSCLQVWHGLGNGKRVAQFHAGSGFQVDQLEDVDSSQEQQSPREDPPHGQLEAAGAPSGVATGTPQLLEPGGSIWIGNHRNDWKSRWWCYSTLTAAFPLLHGRRVPIFVARLTCGRTNVMERK